MEEQIRKREKVTLDKIAFGQAFKMVDTERCLVKVNLAVEAALKDVIDVSVVYCMIVSDGSIITLEGNLVVHPLNVKVVEK